MDHFINHTTFFKINLTSLIYDDRDSYFTISEVEFVKYARINILSFFSHYNHHLRKNRENEQKTKPLEW